MEKENKGNIIIYQSEDGNTHLEVRLDDKTVWLTQQQMADLYQTSRTNVVEHIKHIYEEKELTEEATCRKFRQVASLSNSPSSYICFICSTTLVLEV